MSDFRNFNQDYFPNDTRVHKLKIKRARKGRFFRMSLMLLAVLGTLLYGAFVYADDLWVLVADRYFSDRLSSVSGSEMPSEDGGKWLNVMLAGVDQRKNEPSRSDTLMVAMLNLKEKSIQVISIPRDTRVRIEGISYKTRINHSHSLGGVDLTRKTVEELLGIPIHNYVETNFEGFKNIIDDLGGVDLEVEKRMYYPAEGINLRKGFQHLDGEDALGYVRFRSDGKGDLPRIKRQHKFLSALSEQVLRPKTLLKLPKIVGELHNNINTDMSVKDMLVLSGEFKNVKSENVRFTDIPGAPKYVNGASYYVVDPDKLKIFMEEVLAGRDPEADPKKYEAIDKGKEDTSTDKKDVSRATKKGKVNIEVYSDKNNKAAQETKKKTSDSENGKPSTKDSEEDRQEKPPGGDAENPLEKSREETGDIPDDDSQTATENNPQDQTDENTGNQGEIEDGNLEQ